MKHLFTREYWTDRDIQLYIGQVLRYGVFISCAITLFGGIVYFIQQKGVKPNYDPIPSGQDFPGVAQYLRELNTIFPRILDFDGAAIIQLGVVVLIATPIVRIIFSAISFLIEKDYMYVVITLIVLTVIIMNMILGLH